MGEIFSKKDPIKFGSEQYFELMNDNNEGMEFVLNQFAKMVKKYPQTATVINAVLSSSSSQSGHMARQFSFPRGTDPKFMAFFKKSKKARAD